MSIVGVKRFWMAMWLACAMPVLAEEPSEVPNELLSKALEWMKSNNPERRKAAYSTMQLLDESALPQFQRALLAAQSYHEKQFAVVLGARDAKDFVDSGELLTELREERERVLPLIRTDYLKDPSEIKKLRDEVDGVGKLFQRASKMAEEDFRVLVTRMEEVAGVMVELSDEIARIESHREGEDYEPDDEDLASRRSQVLQDNYDGEQFLKTQEARSALQAELAARDEARKHNEECDWADTSRKVFAQLLNDERLLMGLPPLKLDEQLSNAATGHSDDMQKLGFFAHESPVEGKTTPSMRANLANYEGRMRGENIYMGNSSPASAFSAWFGSDGHRFIMFGEGPDELGAGVVGRHWTMMTGKE